MVLAEHLSARGAEARVRLPGGGPRPRDLAKQKGHSAVAAFLRRSRHLQYAEALKRAEKLEKLWEEYDKNKDGQLTIGELLTPLTLELRGSARAA
mgnify:CR=1 FL=1